ncbi:MAG: phosphomethylpyrimidine synthase ThiC, partial [Methyloceanibacter sp.]
MNKPLSPKDVQPPTVTTGPLSGSRQVYSSPEGDTDLRVPFREIGLSDETTFNVYDTSGPYTDEAAKIDVKRGLPHLRAPWIEARR